MIAFGKGLVYVGEVAYGLAKKLSWVLPDKEEEAKHKQQLINQVAAGNSSPEALAGMAKDLDLEDWYSGIAKDPGKISKLREQWKVSHQGSNGGSPEEQKKLMDIVEPDNGIDLGASLQGVLAPQSATPIADAASSAPADQKGNVHNEYKPNVNIQVIQQPGEDGTALANRVGLAFKDSAGGSGFTSMSDPAWGTN